MTEETMDKAIAPYLEQCRVLGYIESDSNERFLTSILKRAYMDGALNANEEAKASFDRILGGARI